MCGYQIFSSKKHFKIFNISCLHAYMWVCVCAYIYVYMHVSVCVCALHAYVYTCLHMWRPEINVRSLP